MSVRFLAGDCRAILPTLPAESIHCVVTSPPYFGLRDYGVHGQIGLELTLEAYLDEMVAVARELKRVLRDDGTFWLNIGDSYAGSGRGGYTGGKSGLDGSTDGQEESRKARGSQKAAGFHEKQRLAGTLSRSWAPPPAGFKSKDLMMVPNRLAIRLQEDGWYVRSEIIWHKLNPMPESVTDRPTCAHEKLWFLTKSDAYFYDTEAIKEPSLDRGRKNGRSGRIEIDAARPPGTGARTLARLDYTSTGANKRNVWSVASQPYRGAHFAAFPPRLIEPCILAGCPEGGTVLDPFGGAGTTGLVADRLHRNAILIELNPDYVSMAKERVRSDAPLLQATAAGLELAGAAE